MPQTHDTARTALVVGCGYLGQRVAAAWRDQNRTVSALTRTREPEIRRQGFIPVRGDVLEVGSLARLPAVDTVLYAVGMDRGTGRSMHDVYVGGLRNVLSELPPCKTFIYISSTSVYGQTDGSIVDEQSQTEPIEESGRVVLEAEQLLRSQINSAIILRFAGIYGPNRLLRKQALLNEEPLVGDAEKWLNLIHVSDGVAAVLAAEEKAPVGSTFVISDGTPVRRRDFYTYLAERLGAPTARFEPPPAGRPPVLEANRRLSNHRAVKELGFHPQYPDYRSGIDASL